MTFDEGLSQDTREKPSIAAGIMPTVGDIKKLPGTLDRDRDAQEQEAAARARVVVQRFYKALRLAPRSAHTGRQMAESHGDRPPKWAGGKR